MTRGRAEDLDDLCARARAAGLPEQVQQVLRRGGPAHGHLVLAAERWVEDAEALAAHADELSRRLSRDAPADPAPPEAAAGLETLAALHRARRRLQREAAATLAERHPVAGLAMLEESELGADMPSAEARSHFRALELADRLTGQGVIPTLTEQERGALAGAQDAQQAMAVIHQALQRINELASGARARLERR